VTPLVKASLSRVECALSGMLASIQERWSL
jgi:hypothetical protein